MKVIVTITPTSTTINEDLHEDWVDDGVDIKVRKCPPNYEPLTSSKWYELIVEVDDYSEDDIKNYYTEIRKEACRLEQKARYSLLGHLAC
jgi:hypothetical protein